MTPYQSGPDVAGEQPTWPLRSLSIRQPWAWAIMHGVKTVENRPWGTDLGTIAVHAGLKPHRSLDDSYELRMAWAMAVKAMLDQPRGSEKWLQLRSKLDSVRLTGMILGTVDIADVHLVSKDQGCYRRVERIGWVPVDGSDSSGLGWEPRFCSPWGHVPDRPPPRRGSGHIRHFVLANPRLLVHPVPFRGHQGMRSLDPTVAETVRLRLSAQAR